MVDIELIKQRKAVYGDNFKDIAKEWSKYLNKKLTDKDVAVMMAILKECRIDVISEKLEKCSDVWVEMELRDALADSFER